MTFNGQLPRYLLHSAVLPHAPHHSIALLPPLQVIYVEHDDLDGTRAAVVGEQLDVLLYLALPTEKFTVFISAARLAPVQVAP